MAIKGLGYIGIGASDVPAWAAFAATVLGCEVSGGPGDGLRMRIDERDWRIAVEPDASDDILYAGWEVSGASDLAAVAQRLEAVGVPVLHDDGSLARRRGVMGLASFTDPAGVPCELFWGATVRGHDPLISPAGVSGFVTGDQGMGHIVIATPELAAVSDFYRDVLGFRLSDHIDMPVGPGRTVPVEFLHCNPRHHSYAFAPPPPDHPRKLLHFMLQAKSLDDVGFALDRCAVHGTELAMTLGRHGNDLMLSFYAYTPSGFEVEFGWGARTVDADWMPARHDRISNWGHKFVGRGNPPA